MASRVLVTWECDRCGALAETDELSHPHGWRRITHGEVKGTYSASGTMCAACDEQFRAWWQAPRADGQEAGS